MGFSQGSQFLRAIAQKCPQGMKNLITFGGQHQGIYGLPRCASTHIICDYVRRLLNYGAYTSWVQDKLVQAQYWHDPLNNEEYRAKSLFIGEFNNDKDEKNSEYKENLLKVRLIFKVIYVKYLNLKIGNFQNVYPIFWNVQMQGLSYMTL